MRSESMAIWLAMLLMVSSVIGAEAVPDAVRLGNQALRAAEYEVAYNWFKVALERRPQEAEALAGLGAAAIHLREFDEGLDLLARARRAGATSPALDLHEATARYGLSQYRSALESLDRFDRLHADVPESVFLRAVIHSEEHHDREARALLERLSGHRRLGPKARLYLASLDARKGRVAEASRAAAALQESYPRSQVGLIAGQLVERLAKRGAEAPAPTRAGWSFESGVRAGYDTNVFALGSGQVLPSDVSGKSAGLLNLHTGATVNRRQKSGDVLFGRFHADVYLYDGLSRFNQELLTLSGGLERALPGGRAFTLTGTVLEVLLGEDHFVTTFQLSPSYTFHSRKTLSARIFGVATTQGFQTTPDTGNLSRDGVQLDLGVSAVHTPRESPWQLSGLLQRGFVDTTGNDFGADITTAFLTARRNLGERSDGLLLAGWTAQDYRNMNSRADGRIARDDDLYLTGLTFRRRIGPRGPIASLSFLRYDNHSNIDLFRYQREVSALGATWRY